MRLSRPVRRSKTNGVPEWASCSEKKVVTWSSAGVTSQSLPFNSLFCLYNHNLQSSIRARAIAQAYQYFRIKTVTIRFKPETDTFVTGTALPMLYYLVDRSQVARNFSAVSQFRGAGCRGIPFNREITVRYRPAVSTGAVDNQPANGTFIQAKPLISPWLATNQQAGNVISPWSPSEVDHMGISFVVEQNTRNPSATTFYKVEMELEFEFKKPLIVSIPPEGEVLPRYTVGKDELGTGVDEAELVT